MPASASPGARVARLCFLALLGAGACSHAWSDLEATAGGGGDRTTSTQSDTSSGGGGSTGTSSASTSSTTSTGTGGTAPAPCGGTNVLSWDFSSDLWDIFDRDPEGNVSGGEGILDLPSDTSQDYWISFWTYRRYDLRGDRVFIEVTEVPDQAAGAWGGLLVHEDNGDDLYLDVWQGDLECGYHRGGNDVVPATVKYEPSEHRYWQIREDQGTIFCEVSKDGASWTAFGSYGLAASLLGAPSAVSVRFYAGTPPGVSNPGELHFDNLNGGGPAAGAWCKAESFVDQFPDGPSVPGPAWNRSYAYGGASHDQAGDRLNFRTSEASSGAGYGSSVSYDLTGQRVAIQVLALPSAVEAGIYFGEGNTDDFEVYWDLDVNGVTCSYDEGGVSHTIWSGAPLDLPVWVGLREANGETFCEVFQDGTWKAYGSVTGVVDPTRVDVYMGLYADGGLPPGEVVATFDNYNIMPSP